LAPTGLFAFLPVNMIRYGMWQKTISSLLQQAKKKIFSAKMPLGFICGVMSSEQHNATVAQSLDAALPSN
jgi:hypothetical protein